MTKLIIEFIRFDICFICISVFLDLQIQGQCPSRTSFSNPKFQILPSKVVSGKNGRYISVSCCADGYNILDWKFRKLNDDQWRDKMKIRVFLEDNNRTLSIKEPTGGYDDGFYRCTAEDILGNNISSSIYLYFLNVDEPKGLQLSLPKVSPTTRFHPKSNGNLTCFGFTHEPNFQILVSWWKKVDGKKGVIKRPHIINTVTTTSANRTGETNLDLIEIVSSLFLPDITLEDGGNYYCHIRQNELEVEMNFEVYVINDLINWRLLVIMISTIASLFCVVVLAWYYHFDIIVLYKTYLDPCPRERKMAHDVSIFYEDMDRVSVKVAIEIAQILENLQFRCWLYDRDKKYGGDVLDDYIQVFGSSQLILIILTPNSVSSCGLISNMSSIIPNPGVRRLYILIPNKKEILSLISILCPERLRWIKQELRLQSFLHQNSISLNPMDTGKSSFGRLLTWVVASTPSAVIRQAKERMALKMKERDINL